MFAPDQNWLAAHLDGGVICVSHISGTERKMDRREKPLSLSADDGPTGVGRGSKPIEPRCGLYSILTNQSLVEGPSLAQPPIAAAYQPQVGAIYKSNVALKQKYGRQLIPKRECGM